MMPDTVVRMLDPIMDPITHPTTVIIRPSEKTKRPKSCGRKRILFLLQNAG